jgi:hypothetical protein
LRSLSASHAAVAGMDLMLLALAGFCLLAAARIKQALLSAQVTAGKRREERQRA